MKKISLYWWDIYLVGLRYPTRYDVIARYRLRKGNLGGRMIGYAPTFLKALQMCIKDWWFGASIMEHLMIIGLEVKEGAANEEFNDAVTKLDDGRYLVTIKRINDAKTERDYQEQYFAMLDCVRDHTGNDRYILHAEFKAHEGVDTTKNFGQEDWQKYIEALRWWAFKEFDLAL